MGRFKRGILALCAALQIAVSAWAAPDVPGARTVVAVLDTPVDYEHALISRALDTELMLRLGFVDVHGQQRSWLTLNQEVFAPFREGLLRGEYAQQIAFLNAAAALSSGQSRTLALYGDYMRGEWKYLTSSKWRRKLEIASRFLHGTHVAGITVGETTRLITFPIIGVPTLPAAELQDYDAESERAETRAEFAQLSAALQAAHARVANLSFASSDDIARQLMGKNHSLWTKLRTFRLRREVAASRARVYREELERFFADNPRTVFVLAAGNERENLARYLSRGKSHTALIQASNLVTVGSVTGKGRLSAFSNRSSAWVDLAAPGEGVLSARAGGGLMHMTGTSMAAPLITRRLVEIFSRQPALSAEGAVAELLTRHVIPHPRLLQQITGGNILNPEQECADILEREEAA